jgi:photosystem II stability/assembly factor-like uncharacterized protein
MADRAHPLRRVSLCASLALAAAPVVFGSAQGQSDLDPALLASQSYRYLGPVGNRVSAVVGVPGDPNTYFFGAASGGVFKSTDGGIQWRPVFDEQPVQSIGSLAIAPSDPNVVWAGTGEGKIRSNVSVGNGVYRSLDGGETWTHMGLESSGRIPRIVIHPRDPDVVYVAALGDLYGPAEERGVFRTLDGGETWARVLFSGPEAGAVDLIMDPNNPRILFAATWQMEIRTWGRWSGGPGSGLHTSRDGGDTWTELEGHGLPEGTMGRIGLTMSAADSDRIYALIETNVNRDFEPIDEHDGTLWRSDDGGGSWTMVNADHTLQQRPHYYSRTLASPDDADEVYFLAVRYSRSLNGGEDFSIPNQPGGDHHDMWIDPEDPSRMIVGHDQGLSISTTRGDSWWRPRLPIAQMYHVATDTRVPYRVYGNRQDGSTWMGPSNSLSGGSIPIGAWQSVGGCETGFTLPDPEDPAIVWSGCYDGILTRYDDRSKHVRNVSVWPANPEGWPAGELRYRFQWTFPIVISPHDHNTVYVGSQHVHRTRNGGQSWDVISPDLTTNDKSLQEKTGGLTPDDSSPTYAAVLFAIAESPIEAGVLWAGSNDGLIHVTRDGGSTWTDVTEGLRGLPPLGTFSNIEPSRFTPGTAYVTVDLHQLGDSNPYVFKTEDYGSSWRSLADGIPRGTHSYAHVVREDPVRPGLLYLGTENAVYVSWDDGSSWTQMQANLPHAPVHWIEIQPHFNDLVVATYGRGFWVMDDVTPLQQMTESALASDAHLFAPRTTYRFRNRPGIQSQPDDPAAGENPNRGAAINFYLREIPEDSVKLEIVDANGGVVGALRTDTLGRGLNRVHWDLMERPSKEARIRTKPVEHAHAEMPERGWRDLPDGGRVRPLAPPGVYTVRLSLGEQVLEQSLEIVKDPNSEGTLADIQEQVGLMREIRDAADSTVALVDRIEWTRAQLVLLSQTTAEHEEAEAISALIEALESELRDIEMLIFDLRMSGGSAGQDSLRWPRRLYAQLTSLAGWIGQSDHRPTDQAREAFAMLQSELRDLQARAAALEREDVTDLNRFLRDRGIGPIVVR